MGPTGALAGFSSALPRFRLAPWLLPSHPRDMDHTYCGASGPPALMPYLICRAIRLRPHSEGDEPPAHGVGLSQTCRATSRGSSSRYRHVRRLHRGFPDETEAVFEATLSLVRAVGYAQAFSFKYSPDLRLRPRGHRCPQEAVKGERLQRPAGPPWRTAAALRGRAVGAKLICLSNRPPTAGPAGRRSPWLQPLIVDEKAGEIGDIVRVRIAAPDRPACSQCRSEIRKQANQGETNRAPRRN